MLVLTRHIGETILVGPDIEVTVLGVKGGQVRIGINAPKNVNIVREELLKRDEAARKISRSK